MELYWITGMPDSIRAFAAAQTHVENGTKIAEKYGVTLNGLLKSKDFRAEKMIRMLDKLEHYSTREQSTFQIYVKNVSRVLSFWLMTFGTHLSFLQQSQRFVKVNAENVNPILKEYIRDVAKAYDQLIELEIPREDARYILPQGINTNFVMSGNLQGFYLAAKKFNFNDETQEFIDKFLNLFSNVAEYSVNGIKNKIQRASYPTELRYNFEEVKPNVSLEDLLIDTNLDDEEALRHSYVKFKINLSMSGAHQFIRHRAITKTIISIGNGYIIPPRIKKNEKAKRIFEEIVEYLFDIAKEKKQQYFLPNAANVSIYATSDLDTFIGNYLPQRTCITAQWEIRKCTMELRNELKKEGLVLPIGRCFYYPEESPLSKIYQTRACPESKARSRCGVYKRLNKR